MPTPSAMHFLSRYAPNCRASLGRQRGFGRVLTFTALLALGVGLSTVLSWQVQRLQQAKTYAAFVLQSQERIRQLHQAVQARAVALQLLAQTFATSDPAWPGFIQQAQPLTEGFRDVRQVEWLPLLEADQTTAIQTAARQSVSAQFQIHTGNPQNAGRGQRAESMQAGVNKSADAANAGLAASPTAVLPVLYSVPLDSAGNDLGLDLLSLPGQAQPLQAAIKQPHWLAAPPIPWDGERVDLQESVRLLQPLVSADHTRGFVALLIDLPQLLQSVTPGRDNPLLLSIYDLQRHTKEPIYQQSDAESSANKEAALNWVFADVVTLPGHSWLVRSHPSQGFVRGNQNTLAQLIVICGGLFSLILAGAISRGYKSSAKAQQREEPSGTAAAS